MQSDSREIIARIISASCFLMVQLLKLLTFHNFSFNYFTILQVTWVWVLPKLGMFSVCLAIAVCDAQNGFMSMKSCSDFIAKAFDSGVKVHTIHTDFHMLFDCVPHEFLLYKMCDLFDIQDVDLLWLQSFMYFQTACSVYRRQKIEICGLSGVPQSSTLVLS